MGDEETVMLDISEYVGIPYKFAGNTFENADCIGLVRLFYEQHDWSPNFHGTFKEDWYKTEPFRMVRYFCKNLKRIRDAKDLKFGDLVYFHINGEGHCGIYLEYSKILTTFPPGCKQWDGSELANRSFIAHKQLWYPGLKGCFQRVT